MTVARPLSGFLSDRYINVLNVVMITLTIKAIVKSSLNMLNRIK